MKQALCIDEFNKSKRVNGNWIDIKGAFDEIVNDLDVIADSSENGGRDKLKAKCAKQIKVAIERQLRANAGKNQKNPYIVDIWVSSKIFFSLIYVEVLMNGL